MLILQIFILLLFKYKQTSKDDQPTIADLGKYHLKQQDRTSRVYVLQCFDKDALLQRSWLWKPIPALTLIIEGCNDFQMKVWLYMPLSLVKFQCLVMSVKLGIKLFTVCGSFMKRSKRTSYKAMKRSEVEHFLIWGEISPCFFYQSRDLLITLS